MKKLSSKERKNKGQTAKLKETLAEMSFIEAKEALERGDRSSAVNALNEAIKNCPENSTYYLKLVEVLAETSKTDAINILNTALRFFPDDVLLNNKLKQLEDSYPDFNETQLDFNYNLNETMLDFAQEPAKKLISFPEKPKPINIPQIVPTQVKTNNLEQVETQPKLSFAERRKQLKSQTGRLKETLAEMSFIEAEESLERGDRNSAINALNEAIKNFPENSVYYLKLADVLAEKSKPEAINILNQALKQVSDNSPLTAKLAELQPKPKPKPNTLNTSKPAPLPNKTESLPIKTKVKDDSEVILSSPDNSLSKKVACPACKQLNDINQVKCQRCTRPLSRINRLKAKSKESVSNLSNRLKTRDIIVLIGIIIITLVSFPIAQKQTALVVKILHPNDQGVLFREQPEFQWDVDMENIGFLLVVEKEGKTIVEHFTNNPFYTLSYEEIERLETGELYTWKVIPLSPKRVPLNYKSKVSDFRVAVKLEQESANQNNQ
ncbi:MAG: tetratricopeptide repeat protein [Blastocatellia bacterium]